MTLHEFIAANRNDLIARTFVTQLTETLRLENTEAPYSASAIGSSATLHGRNLLALGFTVSQVVHDYGQRPRSSRSSRT